MNPELAKYVKIFLLIIYTVGIAGTFISPALIAPYTPVNLLLTALALLVFGDIQNKRFWLFALFVFLFGILIEIAGVSTGMIFGTYHYGQVLGPQVFQVPLSIGLNWVFLTFATLSIANHFNKNALISSLLGAGLMVGLDLLIEPLASDLDYWYWANGVIPLQNFIAWYIIALFFHLIGRRLHFAKENPMAVLIFGLQILFFISIHLSKYIKHA
ncbi:MAG: carotenoid biosynthesis protein [Chitinophagales bacterium]|nr:carotenoid biosynthesis protein [Chitinophagales bacterium]